MNEMRPGLGCSERRALPIARRALGTILTRVWYFARAFMSSVQKVPHCKAGRTRAEPRGRKPELRDLEGITCGHTATVSVSHSVVSDSLRPHGL